MPEPYQAFPAAPPAPGRGGGLGRALLIAAIVALGIALPVGAYLGLGFIRGASNTQDAMAPGDADLFATVFLDPSATQKVNLLQLAHRFPGAQTDADLEHKIAQLLDRGLQDSGLSYESDVKPWLGGQASIELRFPDGAEPTGAALIASRDDAAAQKALDKARTHLTGGAWSRRAHDGVTEWIDTPAGSSHAGGYAILNHTVVLGDPAGIDEVIDVVHGHHAAIRGSADYTRTLATLPSDRLAYLYVDLHGVLARHRGTILKSQQDTPLGGGWAAGVGKSLDAFGGLGAAVVAQPTGLEADSNVAVDSAKLDPTFRALFDGPARSSAAVPWIPSGTYGFYAITNMKALAQGIAGLGAAASPELGASLGQMGITGSGGILDHLTGDAALEADQSPGKTPWGALLLGTDDTAGAGATLDRLSGALGSGGLGLGSKPATRTHAGVVIHALPLPAALGAPVSPAYAVTDGMVILATSPDEVARVIDAHAGAKGVASTQSFKDTVGVAATYQSLEYLDVQQIAHLVQSNLSGAELGTFDTDVKPYLAPVWAVGVTGQADATSARSRLFVLIR
jgi:hypothetical protein